MRRLHYILFLLLLPLILRAQGHGIAFALQGGTTLHTGSELQHNAGMAGGADLRYQCLWDRYHDMFIGLETGLGIGVNHGTFTGELSDHFTQTDIYGNQLQYSVSAHLNLQSTSLQVTLPVLFTAHLKGVVLTLGPSLKSGIMESFEQTLTNEQIDVYLPRYDVTIHNEPSLGYVPEEKLNGKGKHLTPTLHLALNAEIGYEWTLSKHYARHIRSVGLQVYANYSIWTLPTASSTHALYVPPMEAISAYNPQPKAPSLELGDLSSISSHSAHPLNLGIRLYYSFRGADYHAYGWHHAKR